MKKWVFNLKLKFCQEGLSVARCSNRDELKRSLRAATTKFAKVLTWRNPAFKFKSRSKI